MAIHRASLEIFEQAGMEKLRAKSEQLTAFLSFIIETLREENPQHGLEILTPNDSAKRGCQLSLAAGKNGKEFFTALKQAGVIGDWREPNPASGTAGVIRLAPVPLYNTFEEVWRAGQALQACSAQMHER